MCSPRPMLAIVILSATLAGCATPPENPAARRVEPLPDLPPMAFEPCVEEAIAFDASLWREYQRDLLELIKVDDPDRDALATLGMTYRVADLERNELRLGWLLRHDPQRFVVDAGLEAFRAVEWGADDDTAMRAAGESTAELDEKIAALSEQYNADPDLRLFAEYFQTRLKRTPEYDRVAGELGTAERELERMLARCLPRE